MAHPSRNRLSPSLARIPPPILGPWPDGPWWLFAAAALLAAPAVLAQGADLELALLASLACLATPGAAIEAVLGIARLALAVAPPGR